MKETRMYLAGKNLFKADFIDGKYVMGSLRRFWLKNHEGNDIIDDSEPSLFYLFKDL